MMVGIDQRGETAIFLDYKGVDHIRDIVDDRFQLLRIDVLAIGTEDHTLGTSAKEQVAILVDHAHVAGAEPSVLSERLLRCLFILEIAEEDIVSLDLDFAGDVLRILGIDPYHTTGNRLAAGAKLALVPLSVSDQRGAFGHTVTNGKREIDLL